MQKQLARGKKKKKPTVDVDRNIYSMLQKLKCNRNVNDLRGKHELNGEGSVMLHPEKIRMQGVCIYIYIYIYIFSILNCHSHKILQSSSYKDRKTQ